MDTNQLFSLSSKEMRDIFGGSKATYEAGKKIGRALRQALENDLLLLAALF